MGKQCGGYSTRHESPQARDPNGDAAPSASSSRRAFLKAGAGLVAAPGSAIAQGVGMTDADAELHRLQTLPRTLIKGGVVLTLDPRIGDFANADVLIEDGK